MASPACKVSSCCSSSAQNLKILVCEGLTFYNLGTGPSAAFIRMAVLYFTQLLFELLPFCYMSFYVFDRKFFLADRASGLYHTSAYYLAHTCASAHLDHHVTFRTTCYHQACCSSLPFCDAELAVRNV